MEKNLTKSERKQKSGLKFDMRRFTPGPSIILSISVGQLQDYRMMVPSSNLQSERMKENTERFKLIRTIKEYYCIFLVDLVQNTIN